MRIAAFEVKNYKGIARAALDSLSTESVVTISGRNGTGKSLLLEALVGSWTQRYSMTQRVGPWGDELSISLTVHLTHDEWEAVDGWHVRFHGGTPAPRQELVFTRIANKSGAEQITVDSAAMQILRNTTFQREHPFGIIDFLPANRLVPSVPSPSVDLGMLNIERVEQERFSMLDQFINARTPMSLPSVSNYLVTLDYQAFLAQRQDIAVGNEYERLAMSFHSSTGKTLLLPEYDPARGSNIEIRLPTGHRHGLSDLSSGEQEMLAMMYFVRRLSAAGGILCIDEPEQHLHPTLQAALFEAMQGLADRAQVLVVSHSVNLISAAPLSGLVQVAAPVDEATNQITRLQDFPGKVDLVAALGVTPADLFQSDMLLIVEGDTDSQWLRAMFPVELGRAHVMVAGSGQQVVDAHETLAKFPAGLPWLCIHDRDLMTDEEVDALLTRFDHLHIWPSRAIESLLLDAPLIVATLKAVGRDVALAQVQLWLKEAAEPLKDEVLSQIVESELRRKVPAPGPSSTGNRFSKMEAQLRAYADVNSRRADELAVTVEEQRTALDARWDRDWPKVVNPKPVLEALTRKAGAFKSSADLMSALVAYSREHTEARPQALEALRVRITDALGGRPA